MVALACWVSSFPSVQDCQCYLTRCGVQAGCQGRQLRAWRQLGQEQEPAGGQCCWRFLKNPCRDLLAVETNRRHHYARGLLALLQLQRLAGCSYQIFAALAVAAGLTLAGAILGLQRLPAMRPHLALRAWPGAVERRPLCASKPVCRAAAKRRAVLHRLLRFRPLCDRRVGGSRQACPWAILSRAGMPRPTASSKTAARILAARLRLLRRVLWSCASAAGVGRWLQLERGDGKSRAPGSGWAALVGRLLSALRPPRPQRLCGCRQ